MARIKNFIIPDRSILADSHNGVSTNPGVENWKDQKVDRVWYNSGRAGEYYGKWWDMHLSEPFLDPDGLSTGFLNRGWRALIPIRRGFGIPNDPADKGKRFDPARGKNTVSKRIDREIETVAGKEVVKGDKVFKFLRGGVPNDGIGIIEDNQNREKVSNWLSQHNNQVIIYNTSISPYEYIVLQNRPTQVDFKGETSWAAIKSMGRNTPIYHYTGAEDTLQFNISWFNTDLDKPEEVINKCRLLESWSKANGYNTAPPVLSIQWGGTTENNLFTNHQYILISATYSLNNFNSGVRDTTSKVNMKIINLGLWPSVATQELIFKRVSSTNLTYEDMLPATKKAGVVKTN